VTSPSNPALTSARYHIIARASFLYRPKKHRLQLPYIKSSAAVLCRFQATLRLSPSRAWQKTIRFTHRRAPGECRVSLTGQALIPSSDMTFASS
jgi:hypothetical protein